ncbi:hypothetical protein MCRY_10915 [Marivita cryptomonadis]|nr:hypothetical protein MCRY_10915 [Marivita cryptomonadis]
MGRSFRLLICQMEGKFPLGKAYTASIRRDFRKGILARAQKPEQNSDFRFVAVTDVQGITRLPCRLILF